MSLTDTWTLSYVSRTMATGFTLFHAKMLESSVWLKHSKETRLVWVTMLIMKDADGVVRAPDIGIAYRARVTPEECKKALKELSSPDEDTMTQEHEGRRVIRVDDGWLILNHEKYRRGTTIQREKWREQKARQRSKKSNKKDLIGIHKAHITALESDGVPLE